MLSKFEILIVILGLLLTFYFVIAWGAGKGRKKKESSMTAEFPSEEINRYLFGVRVLILFLAIVSLILWLFL